MKLLVIGATGGTGRRVVEQALARGWHVTAFVRNAKRLRQSHTRLQVAVGDVRDADSLDRAMAGHDAVICALGHKRWFYPNRILSEGTRNMVDAMARHGIRRLVCQSSLGVGNSFGRLGLVYTLFVVPCILPLYFWDKARQEAVIRTSGLDWTIVRPGALTNGPRRDRYRHGPNVGNWIWTVRIARADVAQFLLDLAQSRVDTKSAVGLAY
jgi:uncharacterized protein YbjT (DUF2867 family)